MAWWAALASLGAGLMSAQTQAAASREGAEAQYKALMESLGLQREMYEYARHQAQPYYQYGLGGLQRMSRMPTYQGAINALSSFQDPLYGRGAIYSGGYNALR
ncbi:MAG: hypothetical protein GWO38_02075, partial [Phycisphaerae bacterium]|nr:hypothetical protein [Phycisphaerae bacterium]NIP50642.1 hypothetical protein [Phycisphaerae bacterium]NIW96969.1 hypothetical protein [Phycisphaerae bacterium]NIX26430.1 hypothetical protein [Phycisphaerae bacterium]